MAKTEILTSPANPLLKEVRRAISRGTPTRDGFCVAETFHLLEEALRSGCEIRAVLARSAEEVRLDRLPGIRVLVLSDTLFASLSGTEAPQGVIALVKPPAWSVEQLFTERSLVVVVGGIQDPGNAGAVVRAAEAFGASGIMFLKGSVNPYNPKAVRASAGSLFRVPMVTGLDDGPALATLRQHHIDLYAAMPAAGPELSDADLTRGCAIIVGSEGHGVSRRLREAATGLRIPTAGVESLNAAMAAGILLYEARRQRASAPETR